ncbi:MAG: homogentisate 1,2-dioxygenase [Euryarchaeota archaeon]|nr:homogentisate 1,2-dioxygenase [Euryarchaeota archaeon]
MIDRMIRGEVPTHHHQALEIDGEGGARHKKRRIAYEHCFTRKGFDGAYSILYQRHSPAREFLTEPSPLSWRKAEAEPLVPLRRAHFLSGQVPPAKGWVESRTPLLVNNDIVISVARPMVSDDIFFVNADGDELLFFYSGSATLETPFGIQEVRELEYLWIPKGCPYRLTFTGMEPKGGGPHHILIMESRDGFSVPKQFRNPSGQLTMDAPYTHRDFGRPDRLVDTAHDPQGSTGPWRVTVKKDDTLTDRVHDKHPCDVIGWDGYVYPVTFPILEYKPKTGKWHLPPTIHITFAATNAVVCSFVPRKIDYGPDSIPCPYPHSSVDCDEFLFYVRGHFTSRKGVGPGSISLHPMGMPHAPQPGSYEASIGNTETDELAVMIDTFAPLRPTKWALECEDPRYMESWDPGRFDAAAGESKSEDETSYSK